MFGNFWFKKEKPLLGLTGMGGGAAPVGPSGPGFDATGGTKTTNGSVVTHVFKTSGSLVVSGSPPTGVDIEYLVVGGGGAGVFYGSGGGAGGLRHNISGVPNAAPSYTISDGTYTCTVGDGGEGQWPFVPATFYGVGQGNNSDFYPP